MTTSNHANRPADDAPGESTADCPECGGRIRTETEETVCAECGLVLDDQPIDAGPEWRGFDDEDERERTGAPLTPARHDRGLSTVIGRWIDAKGNSLSGGKRRQLGRLRREQSRGRWRSKAERNLAHGLSETKRVASAIDLPQSIREQACSLFRSASTEDLLPGRSIEAIAAASVFAACRCNGLPRTIEEVAAVAKVDVMSVENGYKVLNRELGLPAQPTRPSSFVTRLASELDVPERVRRRAIVLAESGENAGITTGVQPSGFAAACLYLAGQEQGYPLTQDEIADLAGTSSATIQAHRDALVVTIIDG
jgi:transcription initiation factor TFIIB